MADKSINLDQESKPVIELARIHNIEFTFLCNRLLKGSGEQEIHKILAERNAKMAEINRTVSVQEKNDRNKTKAKRKLLRAIAMDN